MQTNNHTHQVTDQMRLLLPPWVSLTSPSTISSNGSVSYQLHHLVCTPRKMPVLIWQLRYQILLHAQASGRKTKRAVNNPPQASPPPQGSATRHRGQPYLSTTDILSLAKDKMNIPC